MESAEIVAAPRETAARIVENREVLWRITLRAALLCARARNLCRRSRREAGPARRLLHAYAVGSPRTLGKRPRRRSAARLVVVRPAR